MSYLLIAIGSALGGVTRHWCTLVFVARTGAAVQWGTMAVNVVGSLIIGFVLGMLEPGRISISAAARDHFVQFAAVGFLGGYTTFSSFSWQTMSLLREHQWGAAGVNILLSVLLCLAAVAIGFWLATAWPPPS